MKKLYVIILSIGMCLGIGAQAPLQVQEIKLANGFTVWVNFDHSQLKVFGAVVVKAGAKDCPNTGIAHYFEHLLFKGTDKIGTIDYAAEKPWLDSIAAQYDLLAQTTDAHRRLDIQCHINRLSLQAAQYAIPNEFEQLITRYGGTGLNAYTSFDETVYHNTFSPQYLAQWCELNAERLVSPVFRLFQGELETVYEEKNMYSDQMVTQAAEAAQRYALAGTPYAWPIIGSTENLKNPRMTEMRQFYDTYYVAGNMGLMLCGDVAIDSLRPLLERTFGRIRPGRAPQREPSRIRDMRGGDELKIKMPIPVVKAVGYAFKAPDEHSADKAAFEVMGSLLANTSETGLLDSLSNENKVMFAKAGGFDFKDFSVFGFGYVPRIPFGSKKRADRLCWEQVDKLRNGLFSDQVLEVEKLSLQRARWLDLEDIGGRSKAMINAFSHGLSWQQVLDYSGRLAGVTHDDVVRVARKYFNDDSLKVSKKFGHYPRERVTQPGYTPVKPANVGRQSDYARQLALMPFTQVPPKLVDFGHDVMHRQLAPLVTLYATPNAMNNIFTLQLIYRRGARADRRLDVLADYLNGIGTERLNRQLLARELQRAGATLKVTGSSNDVMLTLTGFDDHLLPAMQLLNEFLTHPMANEKRFADMVKEVRLEERSFFKDNANIAEAVWQMVAYGDSSKFLRRLSAKELHQMDGKQLVNLFKQLQHSQLDVVYCGRLSVDSVEQAVRRYVPLGQVTKPYIQVTHKVEPTDRSVVYFYDNPRARQTIVGTCQQLAPLPTEGERAHFRLWADYFGSGMSSLMFQDIREFRAYAYSARGSRIEPDLLTNPQAPCAYLTRMGTQADKTMAALSTLDTLFANMPLRIANIDAARQQIINTINNSYPSFRSIGRFVANCRLQGYITDPDSAMSVIIPTLSASDVTTFYREHIQGRPRAVIIVGNKKTLDLQRLRAMGTLIELKPEDIYHR